MAGSSVEDIVTIVRRIEQQRGKYIKQTLTSVERVLGEDESLEVRRAIRKAVLDGINNYTRAIYDMFGYQLEA